MGRPKHYDDEFLLACVESFWTTRCGRNPREFSYKALSAYLSEAKKSPISPDTLKHNKAVHEKVASLKAGAAVPAVIPAPADECRERGSMPEEIQKLSEINEKLKSFISRTYVHDICRHLINEELNLHMETAVRKDKAGQDVITASMEPFRSPVVREMAAMFDLEEDDNEKNR